MLDAYPSNSKSMCSSSNPPTTLNLRRLHTCVFSYFPNFIFFTMAGRCNFNVKNCGGELVFDDQRLTWLLGQSSRMFLFFCVENKSLQYRLFKRNYTKRITSDRIGIFEIINKNHMLKIRDILKSFVELYVLSISRHII